MSPRILAMAAAALLLFVSSASAGDATLVNGSFEEPGDAPTGWTIGVGATSRQGPESTIAIDREAASHGSASLRLSGDARTGTWRLAGQSVPVKASDRVTLRVAIRTRGVTRDGGQFANAGATLSLFTEAGERREFLGTTPLFGDHAWAELVLQAIVPKDVVRAEAGLFLSLTGTAWFDDVRLEVAPATATDAAGRERAFAALVEHMARTYPFFGIAGRPPAEELFERHRAKAVVAADEAAFVEEVRAMLAELNDLHVVIVTADGKRIETVAPPRAPQNWNVRAIQAALTEKTVTERNLLAGRIGTGADAIGYVLIGTFQLDKAGIASVTKAVNDLSDTKALILDVRANGGGDETLAAQIAGRFTAKPVVYARCVWRDPCAAATDAFGKPFDRTLMAATQDKCDERRVVVLQGPYCVSSTEGFLMMMRALPNVTTIGLPSRGASANPAPFDLLPGVKVLISRWRSLTPEGECIEGKGLAPQIVVDESHVKGDPTLERALAELRR